jgi:hypothetical protein
VILVNVIIIIVVVVVVVVAADDIFCDKLFSSLAPLLFNMQHGRESN